MMKLTFNSTMSAIEFSEDNIKHIEEKFNVSIRKYVSYKISDDDDRQHWEDVKPGDFVCQGESFGHIQVVKENEFKALVGEAVHAEDIPEIEG